MTTLILKWLGALFIVGSGIGIGFGGALELKRRVRVITDLIASLVTIRAEITIRATPMPELVEELAGSAPASVRPFYARLARSMPYLGQRRFADIWSREAERSEELGLKPDELTELISLGSSLGRYDASAQEAAINLTISRLNTQLEAAREESKNGGRLVMGLGVAGGLILAVILI